MSYKDEEVKALYWLYNTRYPRKRKYGDSDVVGSQVSDASRLGGEETQLSHEITDLLDES